VSSQWSGVSGQWSVGEDEDEDEEVEESIEEHGWGRA
jgi:hypothetical protein